VTAEFSRGVWLVASMAVVLGAACGGSETSAIPPTLTPTPGATALSPTPNASPTCSPSGTALEISAQKDPSNPTGYRFDKDCLAAPADSRFTIKFDNRDAELHNIEILDHPGGTSFFAGKTIAGPKTITYTVKPLPAASYYFRCDIHPLRMNGTLVVAG
jgi:plastocyanin